MEKISVQDNLFISEIKIGLFTDISFSFLSNKLVFAVTKIKTTDFLNLKIT